MPNRILTASASLGGGTLTAWKRRSSERSFSIDLRNSAGRGGADALDFAARKRRLQDIGGVQRAFGRARAHQRVQLIDEDDGVLVLHQLLHDGLEPLFELAAVLGAGDDQRKIQRQDALVGQERGHVAFGDALRQAFHDGGLADARLADQHRIVLGAAAQDLHHALQFVIAADQRIERVVHGGLGEVAAEFGQQRAFLGPVGGHFLALRALQFFADGGKPQAALMQNLGGEALLLAQQAEQQVLGADVLVVQALGLLGAIGQHALAFVAERQIHRSGNLFADAWCALRSACGWTPPPRANAGSGWPAPCLPAAGPAAGVRFRCTDCRTGWPRSARRRSPAAPSPCIAQT